MEKYYEKIKYANDENLVLEKTGNSIENARMYIGIKGDKPITLYQYPEDLCEINKVFKELSDTEKYKDSKLNYYLEKILALEMIKNDSNMHCCKSETINEILKEYNIDCFFYNYELIHNDYKLAIEKINEIISTKTLYVDDEELCYIIPDVDLLCLDLCSLVENWIDDGEIAELHKKPAHSMCSKYVFSIPSENILYDRVNIFELGIKFKFKNKELKNKFIKLFDQMLEDLTVSLRECDFHLNNISLQKILDTYKNVIVGEVIDKE